MKYTLKVLDDKNVHRRFRASNYQSTTRVKPFICTMPMKLDDGWNQIQFNLADFTRRAYGTNYIETLRVQVLISMDVEIIMNYSFGFLLFYYPINNRFMLIVELGEYTSQTDYILKTNYLQSSNCIYQSKTKLLQR